PLGKQLLLELQIVVDLPVVTDPDGLRTVGHGLMPRLGEIEDRQPAMAKGQPELPMAGRGGAWIEPTRLQIRQRAGEILRGQLVVMAMTVSALRCQQHATGIVRLTMRLGVTEAHDVERLDRMTTEAIETRDPTHQ